MGDSQGAEGAPDLPDVQDVPGRERSAGPPHGGGNGAGGGDGGHGGHGPEAEAFSPAYRNYVLGVLFVVYVFNFIDRQILAILLQPISEELQVSDTQLGFLAGIAFAIFYTFAGIPIARYADSAVRRSVIAAGLAVWSAMTAASGLARSFAHLALARVGVGIGEAACSPPAHSLIADYFPVERRATALAIYATGIHVGTFLGFMAGGWLREFFDWRVAFFAVGLPGLALAVLMRLTVREPRRGHSEGVFEDEALPPTKEVLRFLWRLRSFRHLSVAAAFSSFAGYGFSTWLPVFLERVHGMPSGEIGTWLGSIIGVFGAAGAFLGGALVDRLGVRDRRWNLWIPSLATVLGIPFLLFLMLWPEPRVGLLLAAPAVAAGAMWLGPVFSMTQTLVRLRMRAVASAILLFVINIIGLGLGPQTVGLLNDTVFAASGDEAVRWSLLCVLVVMNAWAAVHFLLAARTLREDLLAKEA